MSCKVLEDKHFAAIAAFVTQYGTLGKLRAYHKPTIATRSDPVFTGMEVAEEMRRENNRSYESRYNDATERALAPLPAVRTPTPGEMAGILRSWDYQSCESSDYRDTLAFVMLMSLYELAMEVVANSEMALDPNPEGKTYEWA